MDSIGFAIAAMEEEDISRKNLQKIHRRRLRDACNPFDLEEQIFKKKFRLNKAAFKYMLEELEQELGTVATFSISSISRLVAVLRFMGDGEYQHGVGEDHEVGMAQSTFSETLTRVLDILERKLCPVWINLDMSDAEKRQTKLDFYHMARFPGVIMCIDGTHIKIAPPKGKHLYYNQKGYCSLNVMLICDNKMRIRYVDAQNPGSKHDSQVWNLSTARTYFEKKFLEGDRSSWILGDTEYALEPWLITPYRSKETGSNKSLFNKAHSTTRNIVKKTIGVLKNRFRCTSGARQLYYSPRKAAQIIKVACALHNICLHFCVEDEFPVIEEIEDETRESSQIIQSDYHNVASQIRDNILKTFT